MRKYIVERIDVDGYDRTLKIKDTITNQKWIVSFFEYEEDKTNIKIGDIIAGRLFIRFVCDISKTNKMLMARQTIKGSSYIKAIVKVLRKTEDDNLISETSISKDELLIKLESSMACEKNDIIFVEGELSLQMESVED